MSQHQVEVEGFPPFNATHGESLLDASERAGVPIEAACGGFAACNSCRVLVLDGGATLGPLEEEEAGFLDAPGQRLACQVQVGGAVRCRLAPGI